MNNQVKTILLLGALSALLVGLGTVIAPGSLYLFLALAALLNLGAYFFSDRLVLRMHGARPISPADSPAVHEIVQELSARAGIPTPRLYLVPAPHANAFATGRNPEHGVVAVTQGLLQTLDLRELRGVLAHEIAHIRNRDILIASVAATLAAAVSYIANMLQWTAIFGGGSQQDRESQGPGLLAALVAPIGAMMVQLAISRSREYLADETAARLTGEPEALAGALARLSASAEVVPGDVEPATASLFIVNPFAGAQGIATLFATHPPVRERIKRLRALTAGAGRWAGRAGYTWDARAASNS
jgi:heat shock protein HtpX